MEADVKKANMPLKFISLLERWWELNRSGADKESGDIKAIVSFQIEKRTEYTFSRHDHYVENISSFHFTFFSLLLLLQQQQLLVIASRGSRPVQRHRTSYRHTDRKGSYQQQFVSLFLFISLHIRKKNIYKRSV